MYNSGTVRQDYAGAGLGFSASSRDVRITTPITTQTSAVLKIGPQPIATKSTTAPRNGPGERNTRSARLPAAPPNTSPTAIAAAVDTTCRLRQASTAMIPPTTTANSTEYAPPHEKAAPA